MRRWTKAARSATTAYADALVRRTEIVAALTDWLAGFDAVLTPPAPGPAPQDLTQTGDPACCSLWSLAGFPALSLPIALAPNGLPLGMQLAAPALHDQRLLAVANVVRAAAAFSRPGLSQDARVRR